MTSLDIWGIRYCHVTARAGCPSGHSACSDILIRKTFVFHSICNINGTLQRPTAARADIVCHTTSWQHQAQPSTTPGATICLVMPQVGGEGTTWGSRTNKSRDLVHHSHHTTTWAHQHPFDRHNHPPQIWWQHTVCMDHWTKHRPRGFVQHHGVTPLKQGATPTQCFGHAWPEPRAQTARASIMPVRVHQQHYSIG